ncbi:MAG: lysozyme [Bdellovibrionales bacterium]|jgi:lysozyme
MEGLGETTGRALGAMPWMARRINEVGLTLIKNYEGLHLKAYRCPKGLWTIGYGHTRTTYPTMVIDEAEANRLLLEDLNVFERAVARLVKVPLEDNEFAALVSFVFNVGVAAFDGSTLLKLLNRGWYEQVPAQLNRWVHCNGEELGGLARRRAAEGALWRKR